MANHLQSLYENACRDYFGQFLPDLCGRVLIPGVQSLNCRMGVIIEDLQCDGWTLAIRSGCLECVTQGLVDAGCVFRLDAQTCLEVVTGVLAPDKAFFDLRIEIEDDITLGLQLSTVLAPFFRQHPYTGTSL